MEIDLERFEGFAMRGAVHQGKWGDGRERACLLSAVVADAKSEEDCAARGWPLWLAEITVWLFDGYPEASAVARGRALIQAIAAADSRGVDWDRVFRDLRLKTVLPVALRSIGDGDEPWQVAWRALVQWSIDHDGAAAGPAWAAEAPWAARAARDEIDRTLIKLLALDQPST